MINGRGTKRGGGNRRSNRESGLGPSGICSCVKCGYSSQKDLGTPCMDKRCPDCGATLFREGGPHYLAAMNKKK